jgi:hypothetical protein
MGAPPRPLRRGDKAARVLLHVRGLRPRAFSLPEGPGGGAAGHRAVEGRTCRVPSRTRGHYRLPPRAAAACGLAVLLGTLVAPGACGLKTAPRPLDRVLPPTDGVRTWQREGDAIVAWVAPGELQLTRYHGLRGFELWLQPRPLLCLECALPEPRRVKLPASGAPLRQQGSSFFYALPLDAEVGQLTVRVSTRFGLGLGPPSPPAVLERAAAIPRPRLDWQWAGAGAGARSVLFYWQAVQERIVQVIGTDAQPRERTKYFRANLYRRLPPADWPPLPLNGEPLQTAHWVVPPLQAEFPPGTTDEGYSLRFVDQFGNEGPPSPEVLIPLSGRRP